MRKVLFHYDGDHSHRLAVSELGLRDHVHYPDYGLGKEDPMEPVNALHSYLSRFLTQLLGFDRDDSLDWVNLFWVSMSFRPLEIAAKYIIERMISTKITARCRGFAEGTEKSSINRHLSAHLCKRGYVFKKRGNRRMGYFAFARSKLTPAKRIPVATLALSELTCPTIGILTIKSLLRNTRFEIPNPSLPTTITIGPE